MEERLISFIDERSDGDLVLLCKEIYDWHSTGNLSEDSFMYKISKDFSCTSNHAEELILDKSFEKLGKAVLVLLERMPFKFFKNFPVD